MPEYNDDWKQPGDMLYEATIDNYFTRQPMIDIKPDNTAAPARWSPEIGWYVDDR